MIVHFKNIFIYVAITIILSIGIYSITFLDITKEFLAKKNIENSQSNQPNFLLINAKLIEFNNNGSTDYYLETTKMQQYSNSNIIYLDTIKFYDYNDHKSYLATKISSNFGKLDLDKKLLILTKNIELSQIGNNYLNGLKIYTNSLTINYYDKFIYNDDPINIIYKTSNINARGIKFNYLDGCLEFKHKVNTKYIPHK
jgi:LPS export ABC transporter protein LptC